MFCQKTLYKMWCISDTLSWSCQSPVAHSCCILNHPNNFHKEMFKRNAKFDADLLLYLLSHFECDSHTVHMLTQWCLPPPLTSTVKSLLFTYAHFSPLSWAATLHLCHVSHCHYINHGWAFSGQTFYIVFSKDMSILTYDWSTRYLFDGVYNLVKSVSD